MNDRWNAAGSTGGVLLSALFALALASCGRPAAESPTSPRPAAPPVSVSESAEALAPAPPLLDVTAAAGLDFQQRPGSLGRFFMPEMMGSGGAVRDVDADGALARSLVQSGTFDDEIDAGLSDRLFLNESDASGLRFEAIDAGLAPRDRTSYGQGVAAGDVDNDSHLDLYVTALGHNRLLHNRGDGTLEDITERAQADDPRWSVSAAFADLDGDGWLDLVVGNYIDFTPESHNDCRSENGAVDYCGPSAYPPQPNRILRNLGADGGGVRFEDVTAAWGLTATPGATLGVVIADLAGDPRPEIYVANDQSANRLWSWADGSELRFEDRALLAGVAVNGEGLAEASMGVLAADFDVDGDIDILLSHLRAESHTLYLGQSERDQHGLFIDASLESGIGAPSRPYTGFGLATLDLERDGDLDVYSAHGTVRLQMDLARRGDPLPLRQPDQLYRFENGAFSDATAEFDGGPPQVGRGVVAADFDDDGDRDLVVINNGGHAQLLENRSTGPWIGFRLVDPTRGGRDVFGARVGVEVAVGDLRWRTARTDGGYASAQDPRALVGLRGLDAKRVDVEVVWPDGRVERWADLDVDRYHVLAKGTSAAP